MRSARAFPEVAVRTRTLAGAGLSAAALALFLPSPQLFAQDGFLFRAPQAQLTVRAGPMLPAARSDIFDDLTSLLTLERSDFRAPLIGAELGLLVAPRWEVMLGAGIAESSTASEYRHLIGDDGLPIVQNTQLRTVPLTGTVRFLPLGRGRTLTALAWIPQRVTPYIGAGAGITWYRLRQDGEFVDRATGDIFLMELESRDRAFTGHAAIGADWWLLPRVGLNLEARYTSGSAPVGGSYQRFERMDLSGVQATLGVSFRW
jgi:hypothetical protein